MRLRFLRSADTVRTLGEHHEKSGQKQFQAGAISYLALLNAQRQYQQSRISRVQAQATRYANTAALFQALGGGWWNRADVAGTEPSKQDAAGSQ